jgi:molybdenum cofactor synthesis domain-containing protein
MLMAEPLIVEILCIGNELLRGEIQDTNTNWICRLVNNHGGQVARATMLQDIEEEIAAAVRSAIKRGVGILFTSGGLGPTDDDLTLAAVAKGAGVALELDATAREMVRERYDDFSAQGVLAQGGLNPFREKMAWLPAGAQPLYNPVGTAPGVLLRQGATTIICLPGVPPELEAIITHTLAGFITATFGNGGSFQRTLTVCCNDESLMVPALSRVVSLHPQVYIKSLASALGEIPELNILFTNSGKEEGACKALVDEAVRELQQGLTALGIRHWEKCGNRNRAVPSC